MTRSAALSVALHALLLAPLLLLVRFEPSVVSSFSGMRVQWADLSPLREPGAEQTPSAAVEPHLGPIAERIEVVPEQPPVEAEPPAPADEGVAEASEPAALRAEPPLAAAEPAEAVAEPLETPAEPEAAPAEIVVAERSPAPTQEDAAPPAATPVAPPAAERAATPTVAAEPEAVPIPEVQRAMLAERIEHLARNERHLVPGAELEWTHDGQRYTARVAHLPSHDDTALDHLIVAVSTEQGGERLSTQMRLRRLAFSHFAQFVDRWDPSVQIHDDEVDGRFHSNSEIPLARSNGVQPRFLGKVTTARGIDTSSSEQRVHRDRVFLGGLETGVGRIALPRQALAGMPDGDGFVHEFREDVRIEFRRDGTFAWRPVDRQEPEERVAALSADATYLLGAEDVTLHVRGVVNGKVLVYSADDIVIEDDLTYAADPRSSGADDYLGLVAEKDVEIAPPDVTGPGDLTVQAAIYAKRRFAVSRYTAREHATLSIYGSVTAGSVTATEPRYGTKLVFDARFADARPPRFPVTGRFELADWDAAWRSEPLDAPDAIEDGVAAEAAAVTIDDDASVGGALARE